MLEEKSFVSERARDNRGVQSDLSNFFCLCVGERIGNSRDLWLSDRKHIKKDCPYRESSSLHLRIPGICCRVNDFTLYGRRWPEAEVKREHER